jgi:hypothetical protein
MNYNDIVAQISQHSGIQLGPPAEEHLARLSSLQPPESLMRFYRLHAPTREVEIGNVRLQTIHGLIEENADYVPGADLHRHGFITFATTTCGDAYCTDCSESINEDPSIVIMSHEVSFEELDRRTILSVRKRVADNLEDFLVRFLAKTLDTEPDYPQ